MIIEIFKDKNGEVCVIMNAISLRFASIEVAGEYLKGKVTELVSASDTAMAMYLRNENK